MRVHEGREDAGGRPSAEDRSGTATRAPRSGSASVTALHRQRGARILPPRDDARSFEGRLARRMAFCSTSISFRRPSQLPDSDPAAVHVLA
jgi:hypothetical protein